MKKPIKIKDIQRGIGLLVTIVLTIGGWFFTHNQQAVNNNNHTNGNNSPIITNSSGVQITYANTENPEYFNIHSGYLMGLDPEELANTFLILQNNSKFKDACSLLPQKTCNPMIGESVNSFSKGVKQYQNGYENIEVQENEKYKTEYKQVICVKYGYILKSDINPQKIREKFAYYFDKREDG